MSRGVAFTVVAVAAAALLTTVGLSSAKTTGHGDRHLDWAMATSSLEHVTAIDPGLAARQFDSAQTMVQNSPPLTRSPAPSGWRSTDTERWSSFAAFAAAVRDRAVPAYVKVAHYDNEAWSQTPLVEQRRPGYYEQRFCSLAHANGWQCYLGPAQDLCGVIAEGRGETNARCYLKQDLAGEAARHADIVDVQAQSLEPRGAGVYSRFLRRAAAQARAANPDVVVLGNITPSPGGVAVSPAALYRCARASLPFLNGFYTTVNSGDGEAMVSFLNLLEG